MSRQLAVSSAFSIFALAAMALLAPHFAPAEAAKEAGATIEIAAPSVPALPTFYSLAD